MTTEQLNQETPVEQQSEGSKSRRPFVGTLVAHGAAPYKHDSKESMSYYARLRSSKGKEFDVWGKEIVTALEDAKVQVGQHIELAHMGSRPVTIQETVLDNEGKQVGSNEKHTHVNEWLAREVPERSTARRVATQPHATAAAETGPALGGHALPQLPQVPRAPSVAPEKDVTQRAEPIEKDIHMHANAVDPALARSFARAENAFELVGHGNLDKARQAGIEMNIDVAEQMDTRLGRGEDGHMESRYLENSWNGHVSGSRMDLRDYVATLQKEARTHELTDPGLAARYEAQAKFELASHDGRAWSKGARAQSAARQMSDANADLAMADLAGRSAHMTTAEARLKQVAPQSKSEWIRHTYNLSDLRASLDVHSRADYDHYRGVVSKAMAERQGQDPKSYAMSPQEVMAFDSAFVAYQDSMLRGVNLAEQRVKEQGKAVASEIHGTRKPEEAALDKVPQAVEVNGFESRRAVDGRTLEYSQQGKQDVAFRDSGDRVAVRSGNQASAEVLRGALTVASQKFERISLNGSKEFRENAAREAVRMGLGDRIANQDLQAVIADERTKGQERQPQGQSVGQAGLPAAQAQETLKVAPLQEATRDVSGTQLTERQQLDAEAPKREGEGQKQAATLQVKLMAEAPGQSLQQAGDDRLPVALASKPGEHGRVAGSEQLPVSIQDESSLTAARSQSEAVSR